MKKDNEILEYYEDGKTDDLTIDELKRLKTLKEIGYGKPVTLGTPSSKLNTVEPESTNVDTSMFVDYFRNYVEQTGEGYHDYETWFNYTNSDSGCDTDVSSWSPADTYANAIWHGVICKANLFQVAVKGININSGDGLSVQIRTIGKFGAPTEAAACECVSCASNTLGSYTLTVKQYGMVSEICSLDVFDVGEEYYDKMVESMSRRWAEFFDAQIYSELETASPGTTETLAGALSCTAGVSGSCCSDSDFQNLYNAVESAAATMRENSYDPDYMIISPTVAKILKSLDSSKVPSWAEKELVFKDGKLVKANGLKVIEYCGANSCTDTSSEVMAIIVDSSRAVGAAFGQPPKFESDRNIDCNSTTVAFWSYFACAELDTAAISHIVNP